MSLHANMSFLKTSRWDARRIPVQRGKVAIVTGCTRSIGLANVRCLMVKGMKVIMAVRSSLRMREKAFDLNLENPDAKFEVRDVDLAELDSVEQFCREYRQDHQQLDLIICNAAESLEMQQNTAEGHEPMFGANHLGHFAMIGHLLPLLRSTANSRVVMVTCLSHRNTCFDIEDLNCMAPHKYDPREMQGASKLCNLLFAYELARRLAPGNRPLITAAHPGVLKDSETFKPRVKSLCNPVEVAHLSTLRAAFDPEAAPGALFGPSGARQWKGYPVVVRSSDLSYDEAIASLLFDLSEKMTGINFTCPPVYRTSERSKKRKKLKWWTRAS